MDCSKDLMKSCLPGAQVLNKRQLLLLVVLILLELEAGRGSLGGEWEGFQKRSDGNTWEGTGWEHVGWTKKM